MKPFIWLKDRDHLLTYFFGVIFLIALSFLPFERWDFLIWDILQNLTSRRSSFSQSPYVTRVVVNQNWVSRMGREPHLADWSKVIKATLSCEPKGVWLFDVPIPQGVEASPKDSLHLSDPTQALFSSSAEAFISLFKDHQSLVLHSDKLFMQGEAKNYWAKPFDQLPTWPQPKTSDTTLFAQDGVSRRAIISYQQQALGYLLAWQKHYQLDTFARPARLFEVYDSQQIWIRFKFSDYYPQLNFLDLYLADEDSPCSANLRKYLHNRWVLIGHDLGKSTKDYVKTPLNKDPAGTSLLEYHAAALDSILSGDSFVRLPMVWSFVFAWFMAILVMSGFLRWNGIHVFFGLTLSQIVLLMLSLVVANLFSILFSLTPLLILPFSVFYLLLPFRLVVEQRRNWEMRKERDVMRQVDELKSHFISMMSHDLKTPIARIQGMLDVMIDDPNSLSAKQREAIDYIRLSVQDLLRLVNGVLNYAKIESQGILIRKSPQNLQKLILQVVDSLKFLAQIKKIEIITECDDVGVLNTDPEVLRQVLSNILENAIKYSDNGKKILVTQEINADVIEIQVSDQGPGITKEDQTYLFSKFFRGSGAKINQVKGTGLGLYLSRYFIEALGGQISLESTLGVGTTVTIRLPR